MKDAVWVIRDYLAKMVIEVLVDATAKLLKFGLTHTTGRSIFFHSIL